MVLLRCRKVPSAPSRVRERATIPRRLYILFFETSVMMTRQHSCAQAVVARRLSESVINPLGCEEVIPRQPDLSRRVLPTGIGVTRMNTIP